ncbi:hypothetical protein BJV77DRAFT_233840 [Russula vinacea]|nr:hypothetical protein BJV77DRAFT_233840 [Russula vinacea]
MRQDRSASAKGVTSRLASKIAPRLYLTCLATAKDVAQLADLGITHVVSAIEDAPSSRLHIHYAHCTSPCPTTTARTSSATFQPRRLSSAARLPRARRIAFWYVLRIACCAKPPRLIVR